jgi:hypothetical protein
MTFPSPPLKFRTVGFPQYGFKSELSHDLRRRRTHANILYAAKSPFDRLPRVASSEASAAPRRRRRDRLADTSDPEALGSPAGCSVPQGHRLLWPHPRLWPPPDALCIGRRVFAARPATRDSPIYSAYPSLRAVSRTPADRVAVTVVVPPAAAFAHS